MDRASPGFNHHQGLRFVPHLIITSKLCPASWETLRRSQWCDSFDTQGGRANLSHPELDSRSFESPRSSHSGPPHTVLEYNGLRSQMVRTGMADDRHTVSWRIIFNLYGTTLFVSAPSLCLSSRCIKMWREKKWKFNLDELYSDC